MTVFISYRHTDRDTATAISRKLKASNINCYLDIVDEESISTENITEVITKNIKKSTHLLAIISPTTAGSWWVPFEIGEATIANRRICSYATTTGAASLDTSNYIKNLLPDYLKKWPMLLSSRDLDQFIYQYKLDNITYGIEESRNRQFDNITSQDLSKKGADDFHRKLKNSL